MKLVILLFITFYCHISVGQNPLFESKKYSEQELKEDFQFWRSKLEKKHPLIYLYRSKKEVDSTFNTTYNSITASTSILEFYALLSKISSYLKDGHNGIVPTQPILDYVTFHPYLIPIEVALDDNDRLLVSKNFSKNKDLHTGNELISINGISSHTIVNKISSFVSREGNSPLHKSIVQNYFRFYYHIIFGMNEVYKIEYSNKGKVFNTEVRGVSIDKIRTRSGYNKNDKDKNPIRLTIIDTLKTAILTINTFDKNVLKKENNISFNRTIREYFKTIKTNEIERLVIDVSGNSGGNPEYAVSLLKHLLNEKFIMISECRIVSNPEEEVFEKRTKPKWYPYYGLGTKNPHKSNFNGELFILIGEETFSTAVMFASTLKRYKRATLIGKETGGNPVIMSGYFIRTSWELPNTKLKVMPGTLCTLRGNLSSNTGRGIIPDIETMNEINPLNFVLKLIDKK